MEAKNELVQISGYDHPERVADVIFVHGLDGDARTTWHPKGQPDHFWPAWLGDDLADIGVWSLDYAVSASAWKGHAMPLYDRADNTLDLFELEGIGQRPIVLSTPHSGADLASWMQYLNKCLGQLLRTNVSVDELEAHHPRLRELNTWYRDHVEALGITTFVYYEKLPTAGMRVVDDTTANPGIPGVRPIGVDEDHRSICKPTSKDHRIYRRVKGLIEQTVMSATEAREEDAVEPPGYSGEIKIEICRRLLRDWPDLADYFDIQPYERARFTQGREAQDVWEWLEAHGRLAELAQGLAAVGRHDLAQVLQQYPPR
jgi:hypothetical protein